MAAKKDQLYLVGHAEGEHVKVWVRAANWELATVAAAKLWGVPWGKVAADCVEAGRKPVMAHVCARCGRFYNGASTEVLCEACRKAQQTEEEQTARRRAAAYKRLYTG